MKRQKIRKLLIFVSFLLFPVTLYYLSPYLIIQGGFAGIITGSFLFFAALFLFSLVFGRAYCGWLCPAGGMQESCSHIVDKRVGKKARWVKYFIWAPWLVTVILSLLAAGGVKQVDFFYMTDHGISVVGFEGYVIYLFILALIFVLAITVGKRGMCHSICWMAPFMVIGTKIKEKLGYPSLKLKSDSAKCVSCGLCTKNCPMSLEVAEMVKKDNMQNSECILCGACADNCGKKAIKLGFQK